MEKWKATRIMSKENYLNKIKNLPETAKQFGGLVLIVLIIFFSFSVLNIMFGGGDELVRKMKLEEERIAEEKNYSESGIITRKTGELIHEITRNIKSENAEKYISIYSCIRHDKKV